MKYPLSTKSSDLSHKLKTSPVQEGSATVCLWFKSILSRKANKNERGQSLVEFALVIPVLLLLMIGIIEFGYYLFVYSSVNTAAREAARYGAGAGISPNGVAFYEDCDGIHDRAQQLGEYAGVLDVNIFYDSEPPTEAEKELERNGADPEDARENYIDVCGGVKKPALGDRIVVQVKAYYQPLIPTMEYLNWIFPETIEIRTESARTIIRKMQVGG